MHYNTPYEAEWFAAFVHHQLVRFSRNGVTPPIHSISMTKEGDKSNTDSQEIYSHQKTEALTRVAYSKCHSGEGCDEVDEQTNLCSAQAMHAKIHIHFYIHDTSP
jgi:hypothetical protein